MVPKKMMTLNFNIMKIFFKGDIVSRKVDAGLHWGMMLDKMIYIISKTPNYDDFVLIRRPFRNHFKFFMHVFYYNFLITQK